MRALGAMTRRAQRRLSKQVSIPATSGVLSARRAAIGAVRLRPLRLWSCRCRSRMVARGGRRHTHRGRVLARMTWYWYRSLRTVPRIRRSPAR